MTLRIALLGLSGVGKSTLIRRLAERKPILHLQASALIKAELAHRAQPFQNSEALRTGPVVDNQVLMISAFRRAVANVVVPVVFDGHSVIDGQNGLIEIPATTFAELGLNTIFYLSADPHVIAARRLKDTGRERPMRDTETLAAHQTIASAAAQKVAEQIGCTFVPITERDLERIEASFR